MLTTYRRRGGPSTPLVTVTAIAMVLACVLVWLFSLQWFERGQEASQAAIATSTEAARNLAPTFDPGPSPTPVPACQWFYVTASSARVRACPDESCATREQWPYEQEVCVYGRAQPQDDQYPLAEEWYIVDMNPTGAFRNLAYMHRSVLKALQPTPRPSMTFTPLPTVTLTPSPRWSPSPSPSFTPSPPALPRTEF
jgi:hypothetical protein